MKKLILSLIFTLLLCSITNAAILVQSPKGALIPKTTLAAAVAAADAAGKTIVVTSAITVDDVTIPATIALEIRKGGIITVNSGKTLSIKGPFKAGHYQVFTCANSTSSVMFYGTSGTEVIPDWWGAVGDNLTDSTDALIACFESVRAAQDTVNKGSLSDNRDGAAVIRIPRGVYLTSRSLPLFCGVHLKGNGGNNHPVSVLKMTDITKPLIYVMPLNYNASWACINQGNGNNTIEDLTFWNSTPGDSNTYNSPFIFMASGLQAVTYIHALHPTTNDPLVNYVGHSDTIFTRLWFEASAGAAIESTEGLTTYRVRQCMFDLCKWGIYHHGTAHGGVELDDCYFSVNAWGALIIDSTHTSGFTVNAIMCDFQGSGSPGAIATKRYGVVINNTNAASVTKATAKFTQCTFAGFTQDIYWFGARMNFTNLYKLTFDNCEFDDLQDASNGVQFMLITNNAYVNITNNKFLSSTLSTYTTAKMIDSLFDVGILKAAVISNNVFNNTNVSSFTNYISTYNDPSGENWNITGNIFNGPVTAALDGNLIYVSNVGNIGGGFPKVIYGAASPLVGTWGVGDTVINNVRTELGTAGNKYVIDRWVCRIAGNHGTWDAVKVLTGN